MRRVKWLLPVLGACVTLTAFAAITGKPAPVEVKAEQIGNGKVTVTAMKAGQVYVGFDLLSGDKKVAAVRFSSNRLIVAGQCARGGDGMSLRFTGLVGRDGSGLHFGKEDGISLSLKANDPYPVVSFDLSPQTFDPAKWQSVAGKQPFHFLAIYMPDATAWHTRGWLNATPVDDPFPLLQDAHAGTPEISAYKYNRNWSYTPPLGADPLPVIGLWAPRAKTYAAFEFQTTRLSDNSEKDVATGYCWGDGRAKTCQPNPQQFVSLVYPYGGKGYQDLVFPKPGSRISSRGVLIWSDNLDTTDDPNRFLYAYLWDRSKSDLTRVPAVVDLSWAPGGIRLNDFGGSPNPYSMVGGPEKPFQTDETKLISGWGWQNESPTAGPKKIGDEGALKAARDVTAYLMKYVKHFKVRGEDCVYWEKPLIGQWTPEWGGKGATTLHNANGFAAGRLFLGAYRDLGMKEYLPIVDGVFNWAKYVTWTRNEFADVPSSPFAIGGTLSASFCLDYYMTFKNAPDEHHKNEARRALDMARSFTYRYMTLWPSDNNRADNLDSSFLWEPNSGRDWTGAACANEVFWNLDTLAQTAVHTGDPILMWALQGSLDRWHRLYQSKYRDSVAQYQSGDMAEGYGLYAGNVYGVGTRAAYGFASPLYMTEPVGSSVARVLAGEKAAMVFNRGGVHTSIRNYRYTEDGSLSLDVSSTRPAFDLSLTVPYVDISGKQVAITRNGRTSLVLGEGVVRPRQALWSLTIKGVQDGDHIAIGVPDENGPVLPSSPPLTQDEASPQPSGRAQSVSLPYDSTAIRDWSSLTSWAGAPAGRTWYFGVPFSLAAEGQPGIVTKPAALSIPAQPGTRVLGLAVIYSRGDGPAPSLVYADGTTQSVETPATALAWRGWPPIFDRQLVVSLVDTSRADFARIDPGSRSVWAVTALLARDGSPGDTAAYDAIKRTVCDRNADLKQLAAQEAIVNAMKAEAARVPVGSIAMIPPSPSGQVFDLMQQAGLSSKSVMLSPEQLVDTSYFTAKRFPVALYAGGENYLYTVRTPGDAAEAIVRYVREGGTLVLASPMPWPMFYPGGAGSEGAGPLTPKLGLPILNTIEAEPTPAPSIALVKDQTVLPGLPESLSYPPGDPRLRSIARSGIAPDAKYTPIYVVTGRDGKDFGDAAGLLENPGGGRILYIWGALFREPEHGANVVGAVVSYIIGAASPK